jgi:hypothetical protein
MDQRALVDLPGHDGHDHRQAFAGHRKEVFGFQEQTLGRSVVHIAAALTGHGLHRGDGGQLVRGLKIHQFRAEEVFLAHGRGPGELLGDGGGRRNGVAAETVHHPGQDRDGRLVAVHQDLLPFPHILQHLGGNPGKIEGKKLPGVKPFPFRLPVDLLGGLDFALPQMVVGKLPSQFVQFSGEAHFRHGSIPLIKYEWNLIIQNHNKIAKPS